MHHTGMCPHMKKQVMVTQTHQYGCICLLCFRVYWAVCGCSDFQMFNSFLRTTATHLEILGKCKKILERCLEKNSEQKKTKSLGKPECIVGPVHVLRQRLNMWHIDFTQPSREIHPAWGLSQVPFLPGDPFVLLLLLESSWWAGSGCNCHVVHARQMQHFQLVQPSAALVGAVPVR